MESSNEHIDSASANLDAIIENQQRLEIMFDAAPDAYYMIDWKGIFLDGNRAAEEMIGYRKEEIIGKHFLKAGLLTLKDIPIASAMFAKNLLGKTAGPTEMTLKRRDGSKVVVEIRTHPVKIQGKTVILGIARDITQRKQDQEELERYREHLEEMVDAKTRDLQKTINLMAGREIRMAELKKQNAAFLKQLEEAGIKPLVTASSEAKIDE